MIQFPTSPFLKVNNSNAITLNDVRMVLQWLCSYVHGWLHVCFQHGYFTSLQEYKHTWQHVSKKQTFTNSWWPQLPPHDQCCPNNRESGPRLDHFAITYISYDSSTNNIVVGKGCTPMWQFGLDFDQFLCCSILWFNASYILPQHEDHNGERKAKRARVDNSHLHLIELPWLYKPMLCSLLVLWVLSSWNFVKVLAHKWEGHSLWWRWPLWSPP